MIEQIDLVYITVYYVHEVVFFLYKHEDKNQPRVYSIHYIDTRPLLSSCV